MRQSSRRGYARNQPAQFSRRAWFLYETFARRTLDLDSATAGNYVEALDPARHIVAELSDAEIGELEAAVRHAIQA